MMVLRKWQRAAPRNWKTAEMDTAYYRLHERCSELNDPELIARCCSICGPLVRRSQYHVTSDVITQANVGVHLFVWLLSRSLAKTADLMQWRNNERIEAKIRLKAIRSPAHVPVNQHHVIKESLRREKDEKYCEWLAYCTKLDINTSRFHFIVQNQNLKQAVYHHHK